MAKRSLGDYGDYVHGLTPARHHLEWIDAIEHPPASKKHLLIISPPGTAKSTWLGTVTSCYILGKDPSKHVGYVANTALQAYKYSLAVRDTITDSTRFHEVFPDVLADRAKGWARNQWFLKRPRTDDPNPTFLSVGYQGPILGARLDYLIIDDLADEEIVNSETMRRTCRQWVRNTLMTRLNTGNPGRAFCILTRWAGTEEDLAAEFLKDPNWNVIHMPALGYWGDSNVLWPGEQNLTDLLQERARDPETFEAVYQGNPHMTEGSLFKRDWWRWVKEEEWPDHFDLIVQAWDTAYKKGKKNCYNACVTLGLLKANIYVINVLQKKMEWPELVKEANMQYMLYKPRVVLIEDSASGQPLNQQLRVQTQPMVPVIPSPRGEQDKAAFVSPITGFVAGGRVHLPLGYGKTGWPITFLNEMCMARGTKILTLNGIKYIENVQIGDLVLTHKGHFRKVLNVFSRTAESTIRLKAKSLDECRITGNHPAQAVTFSYKRNGPKFIRHPASWTAVGNLKAAPFGKCRVHSGLTLPVLAPDCEPDVIDFSLLIRRTSKFKLEVSDLRIDTSNFKSNGFSRYMKMDYRSGRLFGLYLAEGSATDLGYLAWSFNEKEDVLQREVVTSLHDILGIKASIRSHGEAHCKSVVVGHKLLAQILRPMGGARAKHLADWMWNAPLKFHRGLVDGWMDGNGGIDQNHGNLRQRGTTTSETLAWQIRLLLSRLGVAATVNKVKEGGEIVEFPNGVVSVCGAAWIVTWQDSPEKVGAGMFGNGYIAFSVTDKYEVGDPVDVFNLEIEEDNSYVTTSGVVHNCNFNANRETVDDQVLAFSHCMRYITKSNRISLNVTDFIGTPRQDVMGADGTPVGKGLASNLGYGGASGGGHWFDRM